MRRQRPWIAALALVMIAAALCGCSAEKGDGRSCSLSVTCAEIIGKDGGISEAVEEKYPDGAVFSSEKAVFYDGETAFDLLAREMKDARIALSHETSAAFGTYIKGIAGLSSGDFGAMSGWVYRVNGEQPQVGCSEYRLQDGDVVEWEYIISIEM